MTPNDGSDEDDLPPELKRGREIYKGIVDKLKKTFDPKAEATSFAQELQKSLNALPLKDRDAVYAYLGAIASFKPPGFHEHGPH